MFRACYPFLQALVFTDKDGLPIIPISTARAGNVIGGGDFATDRIIPDSIRAAANMRILLFAILILLVLISMYWSLSMLTL